MKESGIKRLYYSISEVSKIADEEQYVLRYWETEFEQLRPQKNRAGNRIYTEKDITVIKAIKKLLREQRYTIEGAKEILRQYRNDLTGIPDSAEAEPTIPAIQNDFVQAEQAEHHTASIPQKLDDHERFSKQDLEELQTVLQQILKLLASFFFIVKLHVYY